MKIGLLGGTFDPPHLGHLWLAKTAKQQLGLDEILFMPASRNPLKDKRATAADEHRLRMVSLLIESEPGMAVSDLELTRGGRSYTVETLDELAYVRPAEYWLVVGADVLKTLEQWKKPEKIAKLARLAVALRPPMTEMNLATLMPEMFRDRYDLVRMAPLDVSATEVRERLERGRPTKGLLSPEVARYIQEKKLYA